MIRNIKFSKGFTLIELLVVIAIIGVLSSVVLASLNTARSKARDSKRKSEINSIVLALSLYRNSHTSYPAASYGGACGTAIDGTDIVSTELIADGSLRVIPTVPSNSGTCGDYYYAGSWSAGQSIAIFTHLENVDANCIAIFDWFTTGSYCNGYYMKVLQ